MLATWCLKTPKAFAKNHFRYILISNLSNEAIKLRNKALVSYVRPVLDQKNMFYASLDESDVGK